MRTWIRKSLSVGVLAAGALLIGSTAAQADVDQNSWDNNGIANGIQVAAPIAVPLNVVGNAIGVAGEANAAGVGVNSTESARRVTQNTKDNNGVLNGLQIAAPIWVPVNAAGNAVGVIGEANAAGSAVNKRTESTRTEHKGDGDGVQNSWDNNGILNGPQLYLPIEVPINLCGNSVALIGEANAAAQCFNGTGRRGHKTEKGGGNEQNSWDNNGIANGLQILTGLHLPINLSGNAIGLVGEGNAAASSHNESGHRDGVQQNSSDNNGILNGAQLAAPIDIPVNVCGNALGILGEANAAAQCTNGTKGSKGHGHHHHGGGHDHDNDGDHDGDHDGDYDHDGDADDDGQYADDHGSNDGDAGADADGYGNSARKAGKSAEGSPVAGLTDGLTKGGNVPNVAGLNLLSALG